MKTGEIRIPVPWGQIAVKTWNQTSNECVLLLHGWHHNANGFDSLVSYLPQNFYYICPDLPGHGRSSPFFESVPTNFYNYFIVILQVLQHFKHDKITIIAHSLGACLATHFTQMYPKMVNKLFLIDHFYCFTFPPEIRLWAIKHNCDLTINPKTTMKTYTYEGIVEKLMSQEYEGYLDRKCAEQLLERMVEQVGVDKYIITNHPNLKYLITPYLTNDYIVSMMAKNPITQYCVLIKSSSAISKEPFEDLIRIVPHVKVIELEGDHYIHQKKPDVVAPFVIDFLLDRRHKL